jgi:RNA-directed DNA polymerase
MNILKQWDDELSKRGVPEDPRLKVMAFLQRCHDLGIPPLFDLDDLGDFFLIKKYVLNRIAFHTSKFYASYKIKKKKGGFREIKAPYPSLKGIQKFILSEILEKANASPYAYAYLKGKSVKDNASNHLDKGTLVNLDIENFFGSITEKSVYCLFRDFFGYRKGSVGFYLARMCCLDGSLPQGAPTSPALSNLICRRMDARIAGYCRTKEITYTRYSDDMSFSGVQDVVGLLRFAKFALNEEGFEINEKKTNIMRNHSRQSVTGLVVNEKLQLSKKYRNKIRHEAHILDKYQSNANSLKTDYNYIYSLLGRINFCLSVNPADKKMASYKSKVLPFLKSSS